MLVFINHDDMRSLELMEECLNRGMYVSDQLKDMKYADVIYMGAKGMDRKNRLFYDNETRVVSHEIFENLKKGCHIFTLINNEYLNELSKKYHFYYHALLNNEEFVCENSILTAEGVISYLITHRRFPLYQSRIMLLGFGHCAKPLIERLIAMNSDITVAVRNEKYQEDIEKMDCHYSPLKEVDLKDIDILINTIPHVVISNEQLDRANKNIFMIDISSYPYGIDHHYALSKGLNSQILPSIPSKYAYGFAGKMIANQIEGVLKDA